MNALIQDSLNTIQHLNPWAQYMCSFLSAVLQIVFPPYPGDTLLIIGGYLDSTEVFEEGNVVFLFYWIGTLVSSLSLYMLGRWKGQELMNNRLVLKFFPLNKREKAQRLIIKYGVAVFFICKFVPGVNSIAILLGGMLRGRRFHAYTGIGAAALIHNLIFFIAGHVLENNSNSIAAFMSAYNRVILGMLLTGFMVYAIYRLKKGWRRVAD